MVLLELIPIGTVLAVLTTQIWETALAAQEVLIESDTFRRLATYLKDIQPVLTELGLRNIKDSQATREALESLKVDVQRAKKLVEGCKNRARFYLLVNCRSILKEAQQVTRDIGKSLSLLSLANAEISIDINNNVNKLRDEMLNAEFQASQVKLQIIDKLELGLREHRTDQGFANDLIREIARAVGVPVEESQIRRELASFKREKEEAALRKQRVEEDFMAQVIALLSRADIVRTSESFTENYNASVYSIKSGIVGDEIPPLQSFICPLKQDVMSDPVNVVATGRAYEREEIERWFASGETIDPVTKQELSDFSLKPNNLLKESIVEWIGRNFRIRIHKAKEMMESGDESKQKQTIDALRELCLKNSMVKSWIAAEGLIVDIVETLKSHNKELKKGSLSTLHVLVTDNTENKHQLIEAGGVEQVVRCLARNITVSRLAVKLLLELLQTGPLQNQLVYTKLCQEKSAILLLVTLLNGEDTEAAGDARLILEQLCDRDENIVQMANASWYTPLANVLIQGTDDSRLIMAKAIANMKLTDQNKQSLGECGAIPPLVKMLSSNLEVKAAALGALQNLSSFGPNKSLMAVAGAIPVVLEHLFSGRYRLTVRESAAAILEQLTMDDGTRFLVDASGSPIKLDLTIHNLLAVQENASSSPVVRRHVLHSLLGMVSLPDAEIVRTLLRAANGIQLLLPLLEGSDHEICDIVVQLLWCLADKDGHEIASFLVQKRMAGFLVRLIEDNSREHVQAAAAGILASLTPRENVLLASLIEEGALSALIHALESGSSKGKENAAGALLRFTDPSNIETQRKLVELNIFPILLGMLNSGTPLAKIRAANALFNFSQSTISLSSPSPVTGCLCFRPTSLPACKVHLGPCGERTTFCLVEAKAIPGLVSLLDEHDTEAAGAGVDALATLVSDDEILEKGVGFLHETNAIIPIVKLISRGTDISREKAVSFLERIFKVIRIREHYGALARIPLVDLATHGNYSVRKKAARVLAQLQVIQEASTYF
eukprot:c27758_g1_i3 orf=1199-4219(+)